MDKEYLTLGAAVIAAVASIGSLLGEGATPAQPLCSIACRFRVGTEEETKARNMIPELYAKVLAHCDAITKRG